MTEISNRITERISDKGKKILSIYFTAGYPKLEDTRTILKTLEEAGADMVELGIPYSDPLADGPTIQETGSQAIANGMSIPKLFEQLEGFRNEVSIPVILMGYLNPVMQYGLEAFCHKCADLGIDGLILPDLPMDYFQSHLKGLMKEAQLSMVFLISPSTSLERIQEIDRESNGFIYAVSSNSTTGNQSKNAAEDYLNRLKAKELHNEFLLGFNIRDRASFENACHYAAGGIIGTAFLKALEPDNLENSIHSFIKSIRS